jgi:hypothetical protein
MQCGASRTGPIRCDNAIQCVHCYNLSVPAKYRGAYIAPFVSCKKVRLLKLRTPLWTGIATCCEVDGSGNRMPVGRDFPQTSRPVLGPRETPVQQVHGLFLGEGPG